MQARNLMTTDPACCTTESTLREAAELMRVTAPDLLKLGVIDAVVPEPIGGAHRNWEATAASLRAADSTTTCQSGLRDARRH